VDISRDHVRRELGELGRQHDQAMKGYTEALDRMVNEGDLNDVQKDEFVLGGLNRRKFLTFGGVSVASAAIFAACGSSSKTASTPTTTAPPATTSPTTAAPASSTTAPAASTKGTRSDITILRTASSLEFLAVATYETAIKSGLVTTPAVAAAAKDFKAQHMDHAEAFVAATKKAGGTPYTKPNPVVDKAVIAPALRKLKNQTDVLQLAWMLENAAAQTYVSTVGAFDNPAYNSVAGSIAGVESRHMTVIGGVLMSMTYPTYVPSGFFTTTKAVKAGTGV
jgi:hypothetical protein